MSNEVENTGKILIYQNEKSGRAVAYTVDVGKALMVAIKNVLQIAERVQKIMRGFVYVFARNSIEQQDFKQLMIRENVWIG